MTETFENIKVPKSSHEEIRKYIGEVMQDESLDISVISDILEKIKVEVKSMYTDELLVKSRYWHAFAGSSVKPEEESLPEPTENGVGLVLEDLITRWLEPVLRN